MINSSHSGIYEIKKKEKNYHRYTHSFLSLEDDFLVTKMLLPLAVAFPDFLVTKMFLPLTVAFPVISL